MRGIEQSGDEIIQPSYNRREDVISLIDLWLVLAKHKGIIFGVAAVTTIGAILYALLGTPVYRAEAVFLPPSQSDIQSLNIKGIKGDEGISVNTVYTIFKRNLSANFPRRAVFDKMKLLEQFAPDGGREANIDLIFNKFNQRINVTIPEIKKRWDKPIPFSTLAMDGKNPVLIAEIVNHIAAEVERVTTEEVISAIQAKIGTRVDHLNLEIQRLREQAKKQRLDDIERLKLADVLKREVIKDRIVSLRKKARSKRLAKIARLEEADRIMHGVIEEKIRTLRDSARVRRLDRIAIIKEAAATAHSLGIEDPISFQLKKISDSRLNKPQIITDISGNKPQLYMRGYEALEAEMASLSDRSDKDPFIPKLRDLQDQLKLLEHNEKITALKMRQDDDPFTQELYKLQERLTLLEHNRRVEQLEGRQNDDLFIPSLREKESRLARLESLHIAPEMVSMARLDRAAYPSEQHVKPKRKLIIVLGMVLGLMLGIFSALFVGLIKDQRQEPET